MTHMVVDDIVSTVNIDQYTPELFKIVDDYCGSEQDDGYKHCYLCNPGNETYWWQHRREEWKRELKEFNAEWDPTLRF